MIDLVDVGQIIVRVDAMLGHHAAHAGAVAAVVVLLDPAGFFRGDFQERADELADPRVDLLPQIDVVRVQRVVEIEHPGVDMREGAGGCHDSLSGSSPRTRGPIRRVRDCWAGWTLPLAVVGVAIKNANLWLSVPAIAGTTMERGRRPITASQIAG